MSELWWLQPGWADAKCGNCGAHIQQSGGDPDWGLCWPCMQAAHPPQQEPSQLDHMQNHIDTLETARAELRESLAASQRENQELRERLGRAEKALNRMGGFLDGMYRCPPPIVVDMLNEWAALAPAADGAASGERG